MRNGEESPGFDLVAVWSSIVVRGKRFDVSLAGDGQTPDSRLVEPGWFGMVFEAEFEVQEVLPPLIEPSPVADV